MKKITFMLLALIAAVSANAQEGPLKVSKYNQAEKASDICGIYYWGYKYLEAQPTANTDAASTNPNLKPGSGYVAITLLSEEDNTVQIWRMFEKPLTATFNTSNKSLSVKAGQVIETNTNGEDIVLKAAGFSNNAYYNGYSTFSYSAYTNYFYTSYWLDPVNSVTGENTGKYYAVSASAYGGYTTNNYLQSANAYPDNTYNAIMNLKYDKTLSPGRADQTYIVQVTQNGNTVSVTNFLGGGKTVDINLHADGTFDIPQQVAYSNETRGDYYTWAGDYSEGTFKPSGRVIKGTGTENELNLGNFLIMTEEGYTTGAFESAKIILTRNSDNTLREFHFPIALMISDAGIASFSSEKNVDFSQATKLGDTPETVALTPNVVTDFTAQKATLEALEAPIPANYGVFVKGEAGDYEVPTVAEAATLNNVNHLIATSDREVQGDGSTIYALGLKDGKPGVMLVTAGTTIAANKAYLEGNFGSGAKFISFDGETTSIDGVEVSTDEATPIYNLQGQRVGQNYRGIVVKNGKKSVVR